jgi:murein DD-endopeptidase MepM/ murein hydrolase activator NlpD
MPVNGDIINPFSEGELVKDSTLGVWRTHDGVDIKADVGTPVKAMNKGTVIEVREDPLWGNCIVIDHGSGVTGYYYSLSKAMNVVEGDRVNAGEVIGAVGDTAECEAAELSHLHFALKKNGSWIDPIEYIGIKYNK